MNDVKYLQSINLESLLSPEITENSENFLTFLRAYYEWLETTKIELANISGNFIRDEQIVGQKSGAYGTIKQIDDNVFVILVKSRLPFFANEIIVGQTSNATATTVSIKENVVRASGKILDNRTIEKSVDKYVDYLRGELFDSIPKEVFNDSRLLALKLREFFRAKSTEQSYRFLFRLLYNEEVEFYYPGDDLLRASDGKFSKPQLFRAAVNSRIFEFLGKTVRGATVDDLADIIDIRTFFVGGVEIAEMTLKFVSGSFSSGDSIVAIDDSTLTTTLYGIISSIQIVQGGSEYAIGDPIIISGDGLEATAVVSAITSSSVNSLVVSGITNFGSGIGYRINTQATVDNTDTSGSGLVIRVTEIENPYTVTDTVNAVTYTVGDIKTLSIINPGTGYEIAPLVTIEDTTIKDLGLLSERLITIDNPGNLYEVGDELVFTGGAGSGANGIVASVDEIFANRFISELSANSISDFETTRLDEPYERNNLFLESGDSIILDGSLFDELKLEEWAGVGPITRIELSDFGSGYTNEDLPTVSITSANGTLAELTVESVQGSGTTITVQAGSISGIGTIRAIDILNYGVNYTTATADATGSGDGTAVLVPVVSGIGTQTGNWVNDDGKLNYKILQDSFFYQDFSYVIRSGLPFATYSDNLKRIIHPAGLQSFGEITIKKFTDASAQFSADITHLVVEIISILSGGLVDISSEVNSKYKIQILPDEIDTSTGLIENQSYTITFSELLSELQLNVPSSNLKIEIESENDDLSDFTLIQNVELAIKEIEIDVPSEFLVGSYTRDLPDSVFVVEATKPTLTLNYAIESENNDLDNFATVQRIQVSSKNEINSLSEFANTTTNKYEQIQGTVSYISGVVLEDSLISDFQDTQIQSFASFTFTDDVPFVSGNGTIFEIDFDEDDVFIANNEYFNVNILVSNTSLILNRQPENVFTNVVAYKQIA